MSAIGPCFGPRAAGNACFLFGKTNLHVVGRFPSSFKPLGANVPPLLFQAVADFRALTDPAWMYRVVNKTLSSK